MTKNRLTRSSCVMACAVIALIAGSAGVAEAKTSSSENGRIVFARRPAAGAAFEIYIRQTDGTQVRLTENSVSDYYPDWSPDHTKIVFRRSVAGNQDLYVMDAVPGAEARRLTTHPAADFAPRWSPDGSTIAFMSYRAGGGKPEIYIMAADGSEAEGTPIIKLTEFERGAGGPQWSPDGSKIVFGAIPAGHVAVFTMDADGKHQRQLTPDSMEAGNPAWSPDGTQIAFVDNFCGPCPGSDVFIMKSNGSKVRQLTWDFGHNEEPGWSPDGEVVSFTHWADLTFPPSDLYTVELDGTSDPQPLIANAGIDDRWADWESVPDSD